MADQEHRILKKIIYWEHFEPVNNMGKGLRKAQLDQLRKELSKLRNNLIDDLEFGGFFNDYPFLDKEMLNMAIEHRLEDKIEAGLNPFISDLEFFELCDSISKKQKERLLKTMFLDGALNLSVNTSGKFTYTANKDYRTDDF